MKMWRVRTGSIDVVGVTAEDPTEAATLVFDQIKREHDNDQGDRRLFKIGLITECIDLELYQKNKDDATYYVLTSKILANSGLYALSKQMQKVEKKLDRKREGH